ncbi:DUF2922 domain-containing protein [Ligilactobacillus sp. WILCCON 0076]|uniref:DUF2922 domain-containing protein n=1 Tax=Ligilactobacillus ubinensis TaxID=2876789 RepID=A0A9X2FLK7_9LACO|nr:DUF2922 domain-containing protein [Ligilactobacillus ubinensis]MCP0887947.1 DUF2922 domain-containing protein [Ligilactobacillus ubinensis]
MKTLDLKFTSPEKDLRHLKLENIITELDEATLKSLMEQIITLNLFYNAKTGTALYATAVSASYITTQEQVVYAAK